MDGRLPMKKIRGKAAEDLLKVEVEKKIKEVFTSALEAVEIRFGSQFDGFENLRARILRVGNDAIRTLHESIENKYLIARQSESINIDVKNGTVEFKGGKDEGSGKE